MNAQFNHYLERFITNVYLNRTFQIEDLQAGASSFPWLTRSQSGVTPDGGTTTQTSMLSGAY